MSQDRNRPGLEAILRDPGDHFATPHDVIADGGFTRGEKRRILESWALDARLLEVAEEENMGGGDRPRLRDVKLALLELEGKA